MCTELQKKMDEKWLIPRKRHVPCVWPVHTYWAWPVHTYFGAPTTGKVLSIWEKGDYTVVFDKQKTSTELASAITKRIFSEAANLTAFRNTGIEAGINAATFSKEFAEKSHKAGIEDFISFFDSFTNMYAILMRDNMHYWVMGTPIIEKMIRDELSSLEPDTVNEIFQTMSSPAESSYSNKIDIEMAKIVEKARLSGIESTRADIADFSKKYFWFPYEYVGPGIWDEKTVTTLIQNKLKEASATHNATAGDAGLQVACIKKYSLSKKVVDLFAILQTLTLMSDDRKRYNSEICYYVNGVIFTNLAKILGVSRDEALYIDQELLKVFVTDRELFKKRLALRLEMLVEITEDGKPLWYEGTKQCEEVLNSLGIFLKVDKNIKEIRGQTAYKGKVTARARVLRSSHVDDFADGDVIVTGMTTPDFAPLIKRASAIITNEGGITCHAAIISRELKKPCITGTRIATQVIKDGDMVEVDATSGVVRILQSA